MTMAAGTPVGPKSGTGKGIARREKVLSKTRIVETAAELVDAEGFDAVTITRVANHLGVQQPALYRHIDGSDDLTRHLALLGRETLTDRLAQSAIGKSGNDAVEALAAAWRAMALEHPGLYAATDRCPINGDPELEAAVDLVLDVLCRSLSSFDLTDEQRLHVACSLRSALHGFSSLELNDEHPLTSGPDDSFTHLVGLLCSGIASLEGSSGPN